MIILGGAIGSWISTFFLYGFGQLVDNSDRLVAYKEDEEERRNIAERQRYIKMRDSRGKGAVPGRTLPEQEEAPPRQILTEQFMEEIRSATTLDLQMIVRDQRSLYTYEEFSFIEKELSLR